MTQKLWKCAAEFFARMVAKLIYKKTVQGYCDWDRDWMVPDERLIRSMDRNIEKRDWVDVANLAMMMDYRDKTRKAAGG